MEKYLDDIELVVVGGESDYYARPLHYDWVLDIREQCVRKNVSFEFRQPTLSHHMKILCECNLVNDRKEGKWHHYSINSEVWNEFSIFINRVGKVG